MMNSNFHLLKSPLTEALIDIRVEPQDGIDVNILGDIQKGNEKEYPIRKDKMYAEHTFTIGSTGPSTTNQSSLIGYNFVSADNRQIVQVKLDGFTFNRLAPYANWELFRDEAHKWWQIYTKVAQPKAVTRLAVRYINRLDLPLPVNDLKDYLRTVPEVSPDMPQGLSFYVMQLQIPCEEINATLILNQALTPPPNPYVISVVLDIDLFREEEIPYGDQEIWEYFEKLRDKKNEVFLACITDKARELFV